MNETDRAIQTQLAILITLYRSKENHTMTHTIDETRLFQFLSDFQDTISTGTALKLIQEFGATFDLDELD